MYNFPDAPAINDIFTGPGGATWKWTGTTWVTAGTLPAASFDDTTHGNRAGGTLHPAVTTSVNGFMSAADKTTFNAIPTTYAPINAPVFTGDARAVTPSPGDSDTSIATTAFVTAAVTAAGGAVPSNSNPIMDGVAAPGVSALYSRTDHVHPFDTSRLAASAYTAADVLAKLITVDGSGSNLDADLLDGQTGTYYSAWGNLTGKPSTFPPTLPIAESDVTNLTTDLAGKVSDTGDIMTGPLDLPQGTLTNAALTFGTGVSSGIYATGSGATAVFNFAVNGGLKFNVATSTATLTVNLRGASGTVGLPGYAFSAESGSGIYRAGAGDIRVSMGGADAVKWLTTDKSTTFFGPAMLAADPTVALQAATKQYVDTKATATAQARSRIVNGAMQISQENGDTTGTANSYYIADQWIKLQISSGVFTGQRVQVVTPNGSKDRLRLTVTTADAALAAGDLLTLYTNIEGGRVADFRYGTASAKQSILRFGFKGPAGTYSVRLSNAADNRSYIAPFTITGGQANTDTEQTFVIPGDITGTWLTDTGIGLVVYIVLAAGTTYQTTAGWKAGTFYGTSAISNGMATASAVFELYDVGLYLDPDSTGLPPKWTMPDDAQELAACSRYWQKFASSVVDTSVAFSSVSMLPMRVGPAFSSTPSGTTIGAMSTNQFSFYGSGRGYADVVLNARM